MCNICFTFKPLCAQLMTPANQLEPPEVILNNQKIIFTRKPILDNEGWLFPLEEVAVKLQDKVSVDIVGGTITIQRYRDKSIVELNVRNGTVTVNNSPFKTLFGYNRIILGQDVQMVPTSALVILLGLAVKDNDEGKLILNNTIGTDSTYLGTIQPLSRKGVKDLLVDYLTVTNSFNWLKTQEQYQRRTEINSGFHNDDYTLTSDFLVKAGTDAPLVNFDTANVSLYKNASPFQFHLGDRPLSLVKSPLLGGITLRGIQIQTDGKLKDSKFVFGAGVLPSDGKVLGKGLSFVRYGRIAEIAEWSTSPNKDWQFSIGEATYNDLIPNQLIMSRQTGALLAASITKTGKYIEGDSNFAFGTSSDILTKENFSGPGTDLLIRLKPKKYFSLFTKGAYYSPGFYPLSGNPYFHDRNEATVGFNLTPSRSNIGFSHSVGKYNFNANRPNTYSVSNLFASTTPFKKGPTLLASYSQNKSQISSTRAVDNLLFPINKTNISSIDLDTLIERRTNSFFRASLLKSWATANVSSSINYFTFANNNPLKASILQNQPLTKLVTYDFNFNKYLNKVFGLQTYFQGSELYKQIKLGFNLGPVFNNKLNLQFLTGALMQTKKELSPIYTVRLNYQVNSMNQYNLDLDKTPYFTQVSALWQYNLRPKRAGTLPQVGEAQSVGRIKGRVIVLEESNKEQAISNRIVLPSTHERGLANVRIHLGNYTIMTDEKGYFEFPSLTNGIHTVRVEYSDLPSYLTSITPEKVDIKVESGKETNFNFVLAYFGEVKGKIKLANEPLVKPEEEPELQDIRVYLEGTDVETLTNIDGSFVLGDVKPGKYKLKVDPDFLPDILEASQELELEVHGKQKIENIQLPIRFKSKQTEIKEF